MAGSPGSKTILWPQPLQQAAYAAVRQFGKYENRQLWTAKRRADAPHCHVKFGKALGWAKRTARGLGYRGWEEDSCVEEAQLRP